MSRIDRLLRELHDGFPRVSGDEPQNANKHRNSITFSPRERG